MIDSPSVPSPESSDPASSRESFDVIVAGAGAVGLSASIALAKVGLRVVAIGPIDVRANGRTVVLLDGSVRLFRSLGLWERLAPIAAPLATMQLIDDTGSLFRPPPVKFLAREIRLDAFGYNIENHRLIETLHQAAQAVRGLRLVDDKIASFDFAHDLATASIESGSTVSAQLVAAADGRRSIARGTARIETREMRYRQSAVTVTLAHERPHRETSTEFHTRGGPFTLVPLVGTPSAPHRSSLVWVMAPHNAELRRQLDDEALALDIEHQAQSMLGRMRIDGPRGVFPITSVSASRLTAPRLALVGEAAHVMPPIGAQGLNLGLRDVAHLADCLADARKRGEDLGAEGMLAAYRQTRRIDIASRSGGVGLLNRSLLADLLPVDFLRGAGLVALSAIGPLRRAAMREGVMPSGPRPRLMSGKSM